MKAIVGIDITGLYESALCLLARLKIENTSVQLVHVDEPPLFVPDQTLSWTPELCELQDAFDESALTNAVQYATKLGLDAETSLSSGSPAELLMNQADEIDADLIAIGSNPHPQFTAFFFGSVGRALAVGSRQSVLIAKGSVALDGPVTVVLTTDHSTYSDRAIELLERIKPLGIERLVLLTAIDYGMVGGADELHVDRVRKHIEAKSSEVVDRLVSSGIPAEYRVVEGELHEAIDGQMRELGADLLIMGAQGHGFIERLFIGSDSLKQVVGSAHSILLLRPGSPAQARHS